MINSQYEKTNWIDGDVVTSSKLNNIENGIGNLYSDIDEISTKVNELNEEVEDLVDKPISITLNGESVQAPSFYAPTSAGTSGYYLKSNGVGSAPTWINIPTIPTKTSDLTNDSGFITNYTDTKNTAGSTNSTSALYLIGANIQSANPQTYSNSNLVYYNGLKSTSSTNQSGNYTSIDQDGDSIFIYSTDDDSYEYDFSVGENGIEITDGVHNTISLTSNGVEIHGLVTPTNDTDAANKKYVDDNCGEVLIVRW